MVKIEQYNKVNSAPVVCKVENFGETTIRRGTTMAKQVLYQEMANNVLSVVVQQQYLILVKHTREQKHNEALLQFFCSNKNEVSALACD